ncbi:MAG: hypothetical protein IIA88_02800, partial [Bacteroidetes bacterium]|nr:hypothetical protein [Bacteroidota bacterium]
MKNKIQKLAKKYANEVIKDRRQLHANPELSFQEYNTSKFVAERLRAFGLKPQEGIAKTGVVAVIEGQKKAPSALRASPPKGEKISKRKGFLSSPLRGELEGGSI